MNNRRPVNISSLSYDDRALQRWGFTIVELMVVIVIIAILAAITIVSYSGITQHAHTVTLESDLSNGYDSLGGVEATTYSYPATQVAAHLASSPGVTLSYSPQGSYDSNGNYHPNSTYCLQAIGFGQTYAITNASSVPTQGYCADGGITPGTGNAYLAHPMGLAVDSSGNLYVADSANDCIRKITNGGTVMTTVAGICGGSGAANGTGMAASFQYPMGLAVDSSGNLYVADELNSCIRKITPSAVVTAFAGTCNPNVQGTANGTGSAAQFNWPEGLAIDSSGNLYIADGGNDCIRTITPLATVSTLAGICGGSQGTANGTGSAAQFYAPFGLAVDSSGNLYVADADNSCIRKITSAATVSTFAGVCNSAYPGSTGTANGTGSAAQFNYPQGVVVSPSGNLYVTDTGNNCIREITPSAVVTTFAGTCGSGAGTANGTGATAQFDAPYGLAVDSSGNLYVADTYNNCIRKITPQAVVTTLPVGGGCSE